MKNGVLVVLGCAAMILAVPGNAGAAQGTWSGSLAVGAVDQSAIGGSPTIAVDFLRQLNPGFALGVRSGYFGKKDSSGSSRNTVYAVVFARALWPRDVVTPYAEIGGGEYSFASSSQAGWFAGLGLSFPLSTSRSFEASARYHSVPRPDEGPLPDFSELHAALRFTF